MTGVHIFWTIIAITFGAFAVAALFALGIIFVALVMGASA